MTHRLQAYFYKQSRLFSGLLLGLSLTSVPAARADYVPPDNPSAPKDTTTTATRGETCTSGSGGQLVALVPYSRIGLTIAKWPTFAWYVPDRQPYPLEFRLFKLNGQRLYKTQMQSQPGVMQVSLPKDQPGLVPEQYIWQVIVQCDRLPPAMVSAAIQVVEPTAQLEQQLAAEQNSQKRIDVYAQNGLWLDALAEALKGADKNKNSSMLAQLLGALSDAEARILKQWIDRLQQAATVTQPEQKPRSR